MNALVERIRDHEIYHDNQFGGLLDEVEAEEHAAEQDSPELPPAEPKPMIPSVGSLK
ncbi:MAG: hypothetical protein ACYC6L_12020 [Anaerolineae bacterium]